METDKRYFIEGLFIIGLLVGMALFFVWLANSGKRDDVLYRIHFAESVSGLSLGDSVKFHGVDVGTKVEIYLTIAELAANGAAVVVASSELLELVGLCHRIVVLHEGRSVATFRHDEFDEALILSACFGQGLADDH